MADLVITPEIEADAQRLAEALGTTPTKAVAEALRAKLTGIPASERHEKKTFEEIKAIIHAHTLAPINNLSEEEILGLDQFGIPEQPYLGR